MRKKPSVWRNAGRRLTVWGIPLGAYLIYLSWCRWPGMLTIYICTGFIVFFGVLAHYGWTLPVLAQRLVHLIRGGKKSGRPWWYRRFNE